MMTQALPLRRSLTERLEAMGTNEKINIVGWVSVFIAVMVHFGGFIWFASSMMKDIEFNRSSIQHHDVQLGKLRDAQTEHGRKLYAIDAMLESIREIKSDLKDVKKTLGGR